MHVRDQRGLTLVEAVVATALFVGIAIGLFSTFQKVFQTVRHAQGKVNATLLANEQFEIVRNLPYSRVGTVGGVPSGLLPQVQTLTRGGMTFIATTTVRNIDHPFDGTAGGAPNDLSPADNKLVEVEVLCTSCTNVPPVVLSTLVAPRDLESDSTNGSLFVRVFDASGQPVAGADVRIFNPALVPPINIVDVTNASGMLQIIDAPPAVDSYQIFVSKAGYSSEQSYGAPTTTNPVKPHATVAVQTVTQTTFVIDQVVTMNISSVTPLCAPIPNVGVELSGTKLVSTIPDVKKYTNWFSTGGSGAVVLGDLEWDTYTMTASSGAYDLAGVSTLSPFDALPGSTNDIQAIMVPQNPPSVMITVRDVVTGLPLTGAEVTMDLAGASTTLTTGRGFLRQTDWSGGAGQSDFVDASQYVMDDTNLDVITVPGEVRLRDVLGLYPSGGMLESSTFDTGTASNFYQFTFLPNGQLPDVGDVPLRFQFASGNSTSSWTYLGPDGTADTYYTSTTSDIHASHNGTRYARYKMFLSTASSTMTPVATDAMFTFTSSCVPPGQVLFQGLADGPYDLTVRKAGYLDHTEPISVSAATPWMEVQVSLAQ
jgi:type II secretory pathway pseudopilin PulG